MARKRSRQNSEVNAGSMADIAFLLLIFFLVTTQIATNKGLTMVLPPKQEIQDDVKIPERNILKIQVNSLDRILVEEEILDDVTGLKDIVYDFVLNFGNADDVKRGSAKQSDRETFNSFPAGMKAYIRNNLSDTNSSDGPSKAVVSFKTDRGSSYEVFISVMDEINAAYYRIYGERVGLSAEDYRKLNRSDPRQRAIYEEGKRGISKSISLAEPTGKAQ